MAFSLWRKLNFARETRHRCVNFFTVLVSFVFRQNGFQYLQYSFYVFHSKRFALLIITRPRRAA